MVEVLPPPRKIGSRAVWTADAANEWLKACAVWQCDQVQALARTNPDELAPDEMIDTISKLTARVLSNDFGSPVDPAHVHMTVHVRPPLTEDEFAACEAQEFALLEQRYAHFDRRRAVLAAAVLCATGASAATSV